MNTRLMFASDYMEGAHPALLRRLTETNLEQTPGYGTDAYCESAREKIRSSCQARDAEIFFLAGGTQTNATVLDALLKPWQGVVSTGTGHIASHEAGAVEFCGHKIMTLPHRSGKIVAESLENCFRTYHNDENRDHMVMPGVVYISQPTEYGTLYSLAELTELNRLCREYGSMLYADGARLAYALACPENDVTLPDLARLCDAFYIGGTKCGALFGEAVVFPQPGTAPHFFTIMKQHGALLAKGRIAGLQFDTLFTDGLYQRIGQTAVGAADQIRQAASAADLQLMFSSPTNQIFLCLSREQADRLSGQVEMSFWEYTENGRVIERIATSWATRPEDVQALCRILSDL